MIIIQSIPFRRRKRIATPSFPPASGPVMSDGDFDPDKSELTVEFDQDVSTAGLVPATVTVNDPESGSMYRATNAHVFAGLIAVFEMEAIGASGGSQKWMTATGEWNRVGERWIAVGGCDGVGVAVSIKGGLNAKD